MLRGALLIVNRTYDTLKNLPDIRIFTYSSFTYNVWSYLLIVPRVMCLFSFIFLVLKPLKIPFLTSFFMEHIHALQVRGGGVSWGSPQTAKEAVARVRGGRTSDTGTSTCTPGSAIQQQQRS